MSAPPKPVGAPLLGSESTGAVWSLSNGQDSHLEGRALELARQNKPFLEAHAFPTGSRKAALVTLGVMTKLINDYDAMRGEPRSTQVVPATQSAAARTIAILRRVIDQDRTQDLVRWGHVMRFAATVPVCLLAAQAPPSGACAHELTPATEECVLFGVRHERGTDFFRVTDETFKSYLVHKDRLDSAPSDGISLYLHLFGPDWLTRVWTLHREASELYHWGSVVAGPFRGVIMIDTPGDAPPQVPSSDRGSSSSYALSQ